MARTGSFDPTFPSSFFTIPYIGISPIRLIGLLSTGAFPRPEPAYPALMVHPDRTGLPAFFAPVDIKPAPQLKLLRAWSVIPFRLPLKRTLLPRPPQLTAEVLAQMRFTTSSATLDHHDHRVSQADIPGSPGMIRVLPCLDSSSSKPCCPLPHPKPGGPVPFGF